MRPPPRPQRVASVGRKQPAAHPASSARTAPPAASRAVPAPRSAAAPRPAVDDAPVRSGGTGSALARPDEAPFLVPVRRTVVPGSAERFAERAAMRRRLTRRKVLWTSAVLVVLGGLAWLLFFSPVLALDVAEVEVRGEGTVVDPAAVMAVVEPLDGTPLPRLDTVDLRRAVLDVPGVRAAEVAREWPHGLVITVVSREPVAAVPQEEGFVLLDVEGVQVGRSAEPPAGLPVISVPVGDDTRAMTAVLTVLENLPEDLSAQVTAVSADSRDTVRLTLADGAVVEWGSADQPALKARVLAALRAAPASAGAAVFDVSAPTMPITRTAP